MKVYLATSAVHLGAALRYSRGWSRNNAGVQVIQSFTKGKGLRASQRYRLYLPIHAKHHEVVIPPSIKHAVESAGYQISDYIAGIATQKDGKRVMKIGKLIKDERLRNMFANDTQRQSHKNEYTCVISCHPYDIIGMSTGRTWDQFSCMRLGAGSKLNPDSNNGQDGAYAETLSHDIKAGTLVAYAVKNSDTDIKNPDARVLIKPFVNEGTKEVLFRMETKVYGNHVTGFREAVTAFLREVNKNVTAGRYALVKGLYNDGAGYNALHIGPLAFADLTDPEKTKEWLKVANIGHISEKFKEGSQPEIISILENGTEENLYKEHIYNEVATDLFHPDIRLEDAVARLDIILPKLVALDRAGRGMIDVTMNKFLAKFTTHALKDSASRSIIRELVRYDSGRNYSFGFKTWAYRFNPTILMQPDGSVDQDLDGYVNAREEYPFVESFTLKADKKSRLYQVALIESFVRFAAAKMQGLRSTLGWQPISPDMMPNEGLVKYGIVERVDQMKWTDAQKLYAYAANSQNYFNDHHSHLIGLPYIEKLTIQDLFNNPYVAQIFNLGVGSDANSQEIANNWAYIFERTCRADKEGVKAHEQQLYDVATLLGEHEYNVQRGIEREIERALYD